MPSVAELPARLAAVEGQLAAALAALDQLEVSARVDAGAALIRQLEQLRDLAAVFAGVALRLEIFAREATEVARAQLATAQLELTTSVDQEDPHESGPSR